MGLMDKIRGLVDGDSQDLDEGYGENSLDDIYDEPVQQQPKPQHGGRGDYDTRSRASNVSVTSGNSIEMKVVKPDRLESVTQIADHLLDRKTILLNLEDTNKETARRLIDFLNGVAYAINGNLKKVANCTYVITPSNVDISGEQLKDSHESQNMF